MIATLGLLAIMAVMFYAGFKAGWREREEKYWRDVALVEARIERKLFADCHEDGDEKAEE